MQQFKRYFFLQCMLCLIGTGIVYLFTHTALSFFLGACLSTLNIIGNYLVCLIIIKEQKNVSSIKVILFYFLKYIILGGYIILVLIIWPYVFHINLFYFILGLLTFVVSSIIERTLFKASS